MRYLINRQPDGKVKLNGIDMPFATVAAETSTAIVIKIPGYSYNPGSRYSMLRNYAPAQTMVLERTGEGEWYRTVIEFPSKR